MNIEGLGNTNSLVNQSDRNSELGKEDFLKLLVAQLEGQDPLNPLDDKEFISQLAQFSSLEQMVQIKDNIELLHISQAGLANSQVVDLVGKVVEAPGDDWQYDGQNSAFDIELSGKAEGASIVLRNADGVVVRTIELSDLEAGRQTVSFDGKDDQGQDLAPGTYDVELSANSSNGNNVGAEVVQKSKVVGVKFSGGSPVLLLENGAEVSPSNVIAINGESESIEDNDDN